MRSKKNWLWITVSLGASAAALDRIAAETVVLKDGTFLEGKIKKKTKSIVQVETRFGLRTYSQKDIEEIVDSVGDSASTGGKPFSELPPVTRAVLNAQADYELLKYERALARLEPFKDNTDNKAVRMGIDWLYIDIHERMGRWEVAKTLLKEKQQSSAPPEKTRAKAHLDILEANPQYNLQFVGKKHARNFLLDPKLQDQAREPGSLRDDRIMRLALEEYVEQILVEDKQSVKAFADKLDEKKTIEAVKKAAGSGDISSHLPYFEDLKKAEVSIVKAQAILGDYSTAFELDLARTEISHLLGVFNTLFNEAGRVDPERFTPPSDRATGALTADGRRQWQQRCDEFVAALKPLSRLAEYMEAKTEKYPDWLRDFHKAVREVSKLVQENIDAAKRARNRTHV